MNIFVSLAILLKRLCESLSLHSLSNMLLSFCTEQLSILLTIFIVHNVLIRLINVRNLLIIVFSCTKLIPGILL